MPRKNSRKPAKPLPQHLSPGRFLIGYAAAAFYAMGRTADSDAARQARQDLDEYLMRVCPDATAAVATAMYNRYVQMMGEPPLTGWDEYVARQIEKNRGDG